MRDLLAFPALEAPPSVSQLARRIDGALRNLGNGWVEGEVRSLTRHRSGHVYLTLADEEANLSACIWRGRLAACEPLPREGELVQAHYERVDFYAPQGRTSLIVDALEPTGEGELLRRRAETLRRLQADGLCDPERRKPLRRFPRRVGVIAGQASAAKDDVIRHLRERFPALDIVFCPALVQGVQAVGSVIDALGRLQAIEGLDVIILARGGGSVADLVAFDDERLCRAVFACEVPVISSIGHTCDRANCDHVAAAYAPVPARAPDLAVARSAPELLEELDLFGAALAGVPALGEHLDRELAGALDRSRLPARLTELRNDVVAAGELLVSRCEAVRGRHELALVGTAGELLAVAARLLGPSALDVIATRLAGAAARLRERCGDRIAALERRGGEAERELRRVLTSRLEGTVEHGAALQPALARGLDRASERVGHLGAVIDARDFSRQGLVLATDEQGRAVTTLADLRVGAAVGLRFADGEADATIGQIRHRRGQGEAQ